MGRRKSVAQIQKLLTYAEARQSYTPPTKEPGASAKKRNTVPVQYLVMSHPGTEPLHYTIRAPLASLQFFGDGAGAELGLGPSAGDTHPPRGFKPAKIHAVKSTSEGIIAHAVASKRPYVKYTASAGQSSFSAPISSTTGIPGVATTLKTIYAAKKEVLGIYGRMYFTPEFYSLTE